MKRKRIIFYDENEPATKKLKLLPDNEKSEFLEDRAYTTFNTKRQGFEKLKYLDVTEEHILFHHGSGVETNNQEEQKNFRQYFQTNREEYNTLRSFKSPPNIKNFLRPLILCGPSGAGKSTCVRMIMNSFPGKFGLSVSHTTRKPRVRSRTRDLEENGVEYFFVNKNQFEVMVKNDEFLEHASLFDNCYGTSRSAVSKVNNEGKICILDIDYQGVKQVMKKCKGKENEPFVVFIRTPSMKVLERRLRGRNSDSEEQVQVRLNTTSTELQWSESEEGKEMISKCIVTKNKFSTSQKCKNLVNEFYGL